MSQQPFQTWQNYQQQEESVQQQQYDRAYYWDGSNYVYYQDLQVETQSRQEQSSLSPSQLPTNVFTFGGLPTYSISQLINEQQTPAAYIDDSNLAVHEQSITGSIQQQNDTLSTQQNQLMHRRQRQQQWLSQYPYSRQREVQTSNELFTLPMDLQNSVQDMYGVFPIEQSEYFQSQVYPTSSPSIFQSQVNILQQSNFDRLGNGFPDKSSQMEIDERSLRSQVIGQRGGP
ncbi:2987_t:CDS:2, partial [Paraglomus brasilianum]